MAPIVTIATPLEGAITTFEGVALASFSKAYNDSQAKEPDNPANATAEQQKAHAKWEADVAKAKAQMTSSLQQLAQMDAMRAQLKTRASYRQLLEYVVSTDTALKSLTTMTGQNPDERTALAQ